MKKIAKSKTPKTGPWVGPGGVNPTMPWVRPGGENPTMPRFATGGVVKKGKAKK